MGVDHTVNMKFNVFLFNVYKRFLFWPRFLRFLTFFFILISTFFYIYGLRERCNLLYKPISTHLRTGLKTHLVHAA